MWNPFRRTPPEWKYTNGLPIGRTAMDEWMTEIIQLAGVPDNRSTRFALSVIVMHTSAKDSCQPKMFFALQLRKAATQEVAHAFITEEKARQKAEAEVEAENKKAEATGNNNGEATTADAVAADEEKTEVAQ